MLFLCWGSFLNAFAYRIIHGFSLISRSFCPGCKATLAWYDLIPVLSWILLKRSCRSCKAPISFLYPFIEITTVVLLSLLVRCIYPGYWLGYAIFLSALIVTIRTDLETMLISRYVTLCLLPIAFVLSLQGYLPLTFTQSLLGALIGYSLLRFIGDMYYRLRKQKGLGEGDGELLAMIGAFIGPFGTLITLMLGSLFGSVIGLTLVVLGNSTQETKIPFGPFLALGAICYLFYQDWIIRYFLITS